MYEIIIKCPNNEERNRIGNILHEQFVGNKHYINSDVVLNIESDKKIKIAMFPTELFNFPDIIIPTSNLENHDDPNTRYPNTRYESKIIATWNTKEDVDEFCKKYNHDNGYEGLSLGNIIRINDGTYNVDWEIAGFDCEHNQTAADGSTYDNGYGICLIPDTYVTKAAWNNADALTGYKTSYMHNVVLPTVVNNLNNVLGNHMVLRDVLLSNAINGRRPRPNTSSGYEWTTAYATLMSVGQITGKFARSNNKYDNGEANYKLPIFNYEGVTIKDTYWVRNIYGDYYDEFYNAWCVYCHYIEYDYVMHDNCVRPLIYIR